MTNPLAPYLAPFAINDWLYGSALAAIPEAGADRRLDERTNSARGIALHLLVARHSLATLLGGGPEPLPWKDLGEDVQAGFTASGERPPLAAVLQAWQRLEPAFRRALSNPDRVRLGDPSPMPIPGNPKATLVDFALLNTVHESYHLGQLGLIAKAMTGKGIMTPAPEGAEA